MQISFYPLLRFMFGFLLLSNQFDNNTNQNSFTPPVMPPYNNQSDMCSKTCSTQCQPDSNGTYQCTGEYVDYTSCNLSCSGVCWYNTSTYYYSCLVLDYTSTSYYYYSDCQSACTGECIYSSDSYYCYGSP